MYPSSLLKKCISAIINACLPVRLIFWINSVKSIRGPALLGECLIETGPWWVSSTEQQPVQITSASLSSASHLLTSPPLPDKMCFCVAPLHQRHKCYSSVLSIHPECRNVANLQPKLEVGNNLLQIFSLSFFLRVRVLSSRSALYASS